MAIILLILLMMARVQSGAPSPIAIDNQMSPFIAFLVPISNGHSNHFAHAPTAVRRNQNRHPIAFHRASLPLEVMNMLSPVLFNCNGQLTEVLI